MKSDALLSCLIPTIPERRSTYLQRLLDTLEEQSEGLPVEILAFYDNKLRTVGEKRNTLIREATGEYIVFLDDDDRIEGDYIATVLDTIRNNPGVDCIVYHQMCNVPKKKPLLCKYSLEYEYSQGNGWWKGKPAHTMPWKASIVKQVPFSDANYGEDINWVKEAAKLATTEARIDRVMYHYDFDPKVSRTRNRPKKKVSNVISERSTPSIPTAYLSVVMSTYNRYELLSNTLNSILVQQPPFHFEVIVVDDGSTDRTRELCMNFQMQKRHLRYYYMENDKYRNPGIARNYGYQHATGKILVCQSDDVIHANRNSLELLTKISAKTFNIATVWNVNMQGSRVRNRRECYTGESNKRPLFFLGSLWKEDCYKIGGNCEEFVEPGYEDDWFGQCLIKGLGLSPVYRSDVVGYHQHHSRPPLNDHYTKMGALFREKYEDASRTGVWLGGEPWPY